VAERIAVLGAAGFVGQALLAELERRGVRATAIVRGDPALALRSDFHDAGPAGGGRFDAVVNLAYPTTGLPHEQPAINDAIVRTVDGLLADGGRLVHISTLAVFGLALDRPVRPGPVASARDVPYVESKIAAEHALAALQERRGLALEIVRLGNVVGAASGAWAVPLVQRLLTGRPVGVRGRPGLSNATEVANAAGYLAFLLQEGRAAPGAPRFHHLAEFSAVPWMEWIAPLAAALEVEPVLADGSVAAAPASARAELASALGVLDPRALYRSVAPERVTGSWGRALLRRLPASVVDRVKGPRLVRAAEPAPDRAEQSFLAIMAVTQEFRSECAAGWTPPVSRDRSIERMLAWLARD
jgi:nucleoside-diphosphate-sugar epimerase